MSTTIDQKVDITCSVCSTVKATNKTAKDGARLPPSWKRNVDGAPICNTCWSRQYVIRAIAVPIATIDGAATNEARREAWKEFRTAVRGGWTNCRRVANWAIRELAKAEPAVDPQAPRLPKAAPIYLYGMGKPWDRWGLTAATANAVLRFAEQRYRACRFEQFMGTASIPTIRQMPLPLISKDVHVGYGVEAAPLVSFGLLGRRWTVQLRRGVRWHHTATQFRHLVANPHLLCECQLLDWDKDVAVKLVAWFPRNPGTERRADRTFTLTTTATSFWDGELNGRSWQLNADHVRGWNAEHNRKLEREKLAGAKHRVNPEQMGMTAPERLRTTIVDHDNAMQRLREDMKYEKRRPASAEELMYARMAAMTEKHRNRMKTWCQQAAAMATGVARRGRCGVIAYNDACQDFMPHFPWRQLRDCLIHSCESAGIGFEHVNGAASKAADPEATA